MEDAEIIRLLCERKEQALEEIEKKYGVKLQKLADAILDDSEDAKECVNDTLLKTWRAVPPATPVYLYAFLAKICRNTALDKLKYHKTGKRSVCLLEWTQEMEQCLPNRAEEYQKGEQAREIAELLNGFLEKLPQEKRMIFMRRYWYGDTIAEIAGKYRISEAKVKMMLMRTRKKLRVYLEKEDYPL